LSYCSYFGVQDLFVYRINSASANVRKSGFQSKSLSAPLQPQQTTVSWAHLVNEPAGSTGVVLSEPVSVDGYVWGEIQYDAGYAGWSAKNWLEKA